jgi:hypothetical protein
MAEQTKDELISELERSVRDTLAYFDGEGRQTTARIGDWEARDVLAHFAYWHYATAWGITSATLGGPPWQLSGNADETNAACLALLSGEGFVDLTTHLRQAQQRLVRAASAAADLDVTVFRMADGREVSIRGRLETIARHWRGHLEALKQA